MDSIELRNIARYNCRGSFQEPTPFCLSQLADFNTEDPKIAEKVADLVGERTKVQNGTRLEAICSIGNCTLKLVQDTQKGINRSEGECSAATYCLKTQFEGVATGEVKYRDIIDNLEEHVSKYGAGNFCPKLACGFSAGLSMDMGPGTAGECAVEVRSSSGQQELPL